MSRSIHTTRRHLQELKRANYADRKARRDQAGVLSTDDLKQLRASGYADWASRLATLI